MSTNKKGFENGCLWIFLTFIFTIIAFGVIQLFVGLHQVITLIIALALSIFFTYKLLGSPSLISLFKNTVFLVLLFIGLRYVGSFLVAITQQEHAVFTKEETITKDYILEQQDTILVYKSKRYWIDNYGNTFTGDLMVRANDYKKLQGYTRQYTPTNTSNFWGGLYKHMEQQDAPSLDLVMQMFTQIHQQKNMNQMEFAEMVVSCVQDIPYSFVFQKSCLHSNNYEDDIRSVLEDCPDCCIGNIPFGVQNPVAFIKNLKGDCDTRTVLIYSILKHFNYDVAIANSDFYRHSILGLNIPATGKQKKHRGKTYTLWETTAKHFPIGDLPKTTNDVSHWNIVLTSK